MTSCSKHFQDFHSEPTTGQAEYNGKDNVSILLFVPVK